MKFIASKDFNQGASNPLKVPGGEIHIKIGTTFSIGDDFTPVEEMGGEDLQTYRTFHRAGCLCPFDSIRGQQIWAEVVRLQAVEMELSDGARAGNPWWKQPVGITILAVAGVMIVAVIATIVARRLL